MAAILELDENLNKFYKKFEAAPAEERGVPAKKSVPDYFLWFVIFCNIFLHSKIRVIDRK